MLQDFFRGRQGRALDGSTHVFRRVIDRSKGSERGRGLGASSYFINDSKVNVKQLKELVESTYHISVDNMCTFLPQDKVGSFSGIKPTELLVETEKAIGVDAMYEPHIELQKLETEVSTSNTEVGGIEKRLSDLKEDNARLERQKNMMEDRKRALVKAKLLKQKQAWLLFNQAREKAVQVKDERDLRKMELKKAMESLRPLQHKAESIEAEVIRIKSRTKSLENSNKKANQGYDNAMERNNNYQERLDEDLSNLNSLESHRRKAQKNVEKAKARVIELQELLVNDFQRRQGLRGETVPRPQHRIQDAQRQGAMSSAVLRGHKTR